jgi:NADP-dependent 3-hydroxy acid dehydrogenase YdfG
MGEAAAKHLSGLGATVVLGARRADRIEKLAKEIHANGGKRLPSL